VGNAASVAAGIFTAADCGVPVIVTRGGGDALSLDVFNSQEVMKAVAACAEEVPVVLAVAHSDDEFFAEQLASAKCATPSEAARLIREVQNDWARSRYRQEKRPPIQPAQPP